MDTALSQAIRATFRASSTSHRPRPALVASTAATGQSRSEQIRARIAANREKRLRIAEAMKAEAGVTEHELNASREDFSGVAWGAIGKIRSPEGENIRQLYPLAHECGHIFLHGYPRGIYLPSHVKEMEAECYAHQAFREHGMQLPRRFSDWGRTYVGSWIEKDRAAGIPIDPRAEAYASGKRSPYEPLRAVPKSWRLHRAARNPVVFAPDSQDGHLFRPVPDAMRSTSRLMREIAGQCGNGLLFGLGITIVGMRLLNISHGLPEYFEGPHHQFTWAAFPVLFTGALVGSCLAMMWRTITR